MKRDLLQLTRNVYDLLIIGGGIYGACVAWDAALRGLSVALVEKADFGAATSANSLKIIHGGLRYLQHADLLRMRQSIQERRNLMRIAPHLVHPLPVVIPTYSHRKPPRALLALALLANDLIAFDRNSLSDPEKHIPKGRLLSRAEVLKLFPGVPPNGLTGGAMFYDAQVHNSERLLLSFLRSSAGAGADVANYVDATSFLRHGSRVIGVEAQDVLTGDRLEVRANVVVNTCGPWISRVLSHLNAGLQAPGAGLAKAINLVTRPLFSEYALGIPRTNGCADTSAVIDKDYGFLFVTPWRGRSLIGTAYMPYEGHPGEFEVTEGEVQSLLDDINRALPIADLAMEDVSLVHSGLLPCQGVSEKTRNVQLTKRYKVYDHRREGIKGLVSVVGVKYTTARHVAEKVVNRVFEMLGKGPPESMSSVTPLHGGKMEGYETFLASETARRPRGLAGEEVQRLVRNYGTSYPDVLRYVEGKVDGVGAGDQHRAVLRAEVLHGIRREMAQTLSDVVFRRTDLGTAGHPGNDVLSLCAHTMRTEMGWDERRTRGELEKVESRYPISGVRV